MPACTLLAPAKINLFLQIVGNELDAREQSTGYHELVMVLQSVSLADQLELKTLLGSRIELYCDHPQVPTDASNLAYRAAVLMQHQFPNRGGVEIQLQKRVPVGAGVAGGSADAAAVLVGLDLLWELGLTQGELQALGLQLGADVPFCIVGGTALALGRGERLEPLPDLEQVYVVLAKYRSLSVSTPWAYKAYRQQFELSYAHTRRVQEEKRQHGGAAALLQAVQHRDLHEVGKLLHNDLEKVVLPEYPQVERLRRVFLDQPVLGAMMSGSGPTVFALVESWVQAERVADSVKGIIADPDLEVWVSEVSTQGVHLPKSG